MTLLVLFNVLACSSAATFHKPAVASHLRAPYLLFFFYSKTQIDLNN